MDSYEERAARSRLGRLLKAAGVALLIGVLMTLALLLAVHLLYPVERSFWDQNLDGKRLSDTLVPEHYYLTEAAETAEIRRAWDEFVLSGHWQVHPWTGLISRRYESRYLNVGEDGRRATVAPSAEHAGRPPLEIWAFGASTLFGWGLSDRHTIPSQLQSALQERTPGRQIRVTNFAVPWYNSSHGVALLAANLRAAPEPPDLVVFFGGSNDLIHSVHYHSESPLTRQLSRAWEERLAAMFAPPPWVRVLPSFPLRRLGALRGSAQAPLGGVVAAGDGAGEEEWIRRAARRRLANRRMTKALAGEFGFTAYFFFEPVAKWLDAERAETTNAGYRAYCDLVIPGDDPRVFDLRGALARLDPERSMTVEEVGTHFSDAAARVLAEVMAEAIAGNLAEPPAVSAPGR